MVKKKKDKKEDNQGGKSMVVSKGGGGPGGKLLQPAQVDEMKNNNDNDDNYRSGSIAYGEKKGVSSGEKKGSSTRGGCCMCCDDEVVQKKKKVKRQKSTWEIFMKDGYLQGLQNVKDPEERRQINKEMLIDWSRQTRQIVIEKENEFDPLWMADWEVELEQRFLQFRHRGFDVEPLPIPQPRSPTPSMIQGSDEYRPFIPPPLRRSTSIREAAKKDRIFASLYGTMRSESTREAGTSLKSSLREGNNSIKKSSVREGGTSRKEGSSVREQSMKQPLSAAQNAALDISRGQQSWNEPVPAKTSQYSYRTARQGSTNAEDKKKSSVLERYSPARDTQISPVRTPSGNVSTSKSRGESSIVLKAAADFESKNRSTRGEHAADHSHALPVDGVANRALTVSDARQTFLSKTSKNASNFSSSSTGSARLKIFSDNSSMSPKSPGLGSIKEAKSEAGDNLNGENRSNSGRPSSLLIVGGSNRNSDYERRDSAAEYVLSQEDYYIGGTRMSGRMSDLMLYDPNNLMYMNNGSMMHNTTSMLADLGIRSGIENLPRLSGYGHTVSALSGLSKNYLYGRQRSLSLPVAKLGRTQKRTMEEIRATIASSRYGQKFLQRCNEREYIMRELVDECAAIKEEIKKNSRKEAKRKRMSAIQHAQIIAAGKMMISVVGGGNNINENNNTTPDHIVIPIKKNQRSVSGGIINSGVVADDVETDVDASADASVEEDSSSSSGSEDDMEEQILRGEEEKEDKIKIMEHSHPELLYGKRKFYDCNFTNETENTLCMMPLELQRFLFKDGLSETIRKMHVQMYRMQHENHVHRHRRIIQGEDGRIMEELHEVEHQVMLRSSKIRYGPLGSGSNASLADAWKPLGKIVKNSNNSTIGAAANRVSNYGSVGKGRAITPAHNFTNGPVGEPLQVKPRASAAQADANGSISSNMFRISGAMSGARTSSAETDVRISAAEALSQGGWGQPPQQQGGYGQLPPTQGGWGQPTPQQGGYGQPSAQSQWGQSAQSTSYNTVHNTTNQFAYEQFRGYDQGKGPAKQPPGSPEYHIGGKGDGSYFSSQPATATATSTTTAQPPPIGGGFYDTQNTTQPRRYGTPPGQQQYGAPWGQSQYGEPGLQGQYGQPQNQSEYGQPRNQSQYGQPSNQYGQPAVSPYPGHYPGQPQSGNEEPESQGRPLRPQNNRGKSQNEMIQPMVAPGMQQPVLPTQQEIEYQLRDKEIEDKYMIQRTEAELEWEKEQQKKCPGLTVIPWFMVYGHTFTIILCIFWLFVPVSPMPPATAVKDNDPHYTNYDDLKEEARKFDGFPVWCGGTSCRLDDPRSTLDRKFGPVISLYVAGNTKNPLIARGSSLNSIFFGVYFITFLGWIGLAIVIIYHFWHSNGVEKDPNETTTVEKVQAAVASPCCAGRVFWIIHLILMIVIIVFSIFAFAGGPDLWTLFMMLISWGCGITLFVLHNKYKNLLVLKAQAEYDKWNRENWNGGVEAAKPILNAGREIINNISGWIPPWLSGKEDEIAEDDPRHPDYDPADWETDSDYSFESVEEAREIKDEMEPIIEECRAIEKRLEKALPGWPNPESPNYDKSLIDSMLQQGVRSEQEFAFVMDQKKSYMLKLEQLKKLQREETKWVRDPQTGEEVEKKTGIFKSIQITYIREDPRLDFRKKENYDPNVWYLNAMDPTQKPKKRKREDKDGGGTWGSSLPGWENSQGAFLQNLWAFWQSNPEEATQYIEDRQMQNEEIGGRTASGWLDLFRQESSSGEKNLKTLLEKRAKRQKREIAAMMEEDKNSYLYGVCMDKNNGLDQFEQDILDADGKPSGQKRIRTVNYKDWEPEIARLDLRSYIKEKKKEQVERKARAESAGDKAVAEDDEDGAITQISRWFGWTDSARNSQQQTANRAKDTDTPPGPSLNAEFLMKLDESHEKLKHSTTRGTQTGAVSRENSIAETISSPYASLLNASARVKGVLSSEKFISVGKNRSVNTSGSPKYFSQRRSQELYGFEEVTDEPPNESKSWFEGLFARKAADTENSKSENSLSNNPRERDRKKEKKEKKRRKSEVKVVQLRNVNSPPGSPIRGVVGAGAPLTGGTRTLDDIMGQRMLLEAKQREQQNSNRHNSSESGITNLTNGGFGLTASDLANVGVLGTPFASRNVTDTSRSGGSLPTERNGNFIAGPGRTSSSNGTSLNTDIFGELPNLEQQQTPVDSIAQSAHSVLYCAPGDGFGASSSVGAPGDIANLGNIGDWPTDNDNRPENKGTMQTDQQEFYPRSSNPSTATFGERLEVNEDVPDGSAPQGSASTVKERIAAIKAKKQGGKQGGAGAVVGAEVGVVVPAAAPRPMESKNAIDNIQGNEDLFYVDPETKAKRENERLAIEEAKVREEIDKIEKIEQHRIFDLPPEPANITEPGMRLANPEYVHQVSREFWEQGDFLKQRELTGAHRLKLQRKYRTATKYTDPSQFTGEKWDALRKECLLRSMPKDFVLKSGNEDGEERKAGGWFGGWFGDDDDDDDPNTTRKSTVSGISDVTGVSGMTETPAERSSNPQFNGFFTTYFGGDTGDAKSNDPNRSIVSKVVIDDGYESWESFPSDGVAIGQQSDAEFRARFAQIKRKEKKQKKEKKEKKSKKDKEDD